MDKLKQMKQNVALTYTAAIPILPCLKTDFLINCLKFPENRMGNPVKFTDPDYTSPLLKELIENFKKEYLPLIS